MSITAGITREEALTSVGAGWAGLVNRVYDLAEPHFREDIDDWGGITQVKEKFGGLTIYTYGLGEAIDKQIEELCDRSHSICEVCGEWGALHERGGWLKTLCDEHFGEWALVWMAKNDRARNL